MSKPSKSAQSAGHRSRRKPASPGFNALDELVLPVIDGHIPEDAEEPIMEITPLENGNTLRWIGKRFVDDDVIARLRRNLSPSDRTDLLADAGCAPAWIAEIFRHLAKDTTDA